MADRQRRKTVRSRLRPSRPRDDPRGRGASRLGARDQARRGARRATTTDCRLTAHFAASTPVGTDEYTLAYTHRADGMDWTLVQGKLQTGQDGAYTVRGGRRRCLRRHVRPDREPQPAHPGVPAAQGDRRPRDEHAHRSAAPPRGLSRRRSTGLGRGGHSSRPGPGTTAPLKSREHLGVIRLSRGLETYTRQHSTGNEAEHGDADHISARGGEVRHGVVTGYRSP